MKLKDIFIFALIAIVSYFLYKKVSKNDLVKTNEGKTPTLPNSEVKPPAPPTSEELSRISTKDNELFDSHDAKFPWLHSQNRRDFWGKAKVQL